MDLITTTSDLAAACDRLSKHPVITVDTEFLRETTYYPRSEEHTSELQSL